MRFGTRIETEQSSLPMIDVYSTVKDLTEIVAPAADDLSLAQG